jgi:hypothetical protein
MSRSVDPAHTDGAEDSSVRIPVACAIGWHHQGKDDVRQPGEPLADRMRKVVHRRAGGLAAQLGDPLKPDRGERSPVAMRDRVCYVPLDTAADPAPSHLEGAFILYSPLQAAGCSNYVPTGLNHSTTGLIRT